MNNHQNQKSSHHSIKFGDRVRRLRLDLRLTQDDVIKYCDISSNAVLSRIENNTFIPSIHVACKLADILNCTVGFLIGESELKNAPRYDARWRDFYIDFTHMTEANMVLLSNIAKLMLNNNNDIC